MQLKSNQHPVKLHCTDQVDLIVCSIQFAFETMYQHHSSNVRSKCCALIRDILIKVRIHIETNQSIAAMLTLYITTIEIRNLSFRI